jgi:ribonuclease BN (tRNA processing enzyme)
MPHTGRAGRANRDRRSLTRVARYFLLAGCSALLAATPALRAQERAAPAAPVPAGSRLVLLGTAGGPPAHGARSQPANLLQIEGRSYLIDAGENAGQQLTRAGVLTSRVDAAFITHLHWDHVLGLDYVMATGWMLGRTTPLELYGPPGLAKYVDRQIAAVEVGEDVFRPQSPNRPPLRSLYQVREKTVDAATEVYKDAAVRVTAVANSHFAVLHGADHDYGPDRSYAYRFDTKAGAIVFTGDTGPSPAVTRLAKGADVLVTEICDVDSIRDTMLKLQPGAKIDALLTHMRQQHLSPEDVGRMATEAGVSTLVLTHYVMGQGFDPENFVGKIRPFYTGKIVVGKDQLVVDVPAR